MTTQPKIRHGHPDTAMASTDAVARAEDSLEWVRKAFLSQRESVFRNDPEAYLWLLDSIAASLYAIAKRMEK